MNKIKALIVDDERNNCDNLANLLNEYCPEVEVVGKCYSAAHAYKDLQTLSPHLVFLDVEMPGGSGFDLLEKLHQPNFEVIFVTAFDQYAIRALRLSAIDYLLKPVDILELQSAVAKVRKEMHDSEAHNQLITNYQQNNVKQGQLKQIALPTADRILFVRISEIVRCQAEGNYTHIFLIDGTKLLVSKTLREYNDLLLQEDFARVHQSHLVNINHIRSFEKREGGYLKMTNGDAVSVSRQRKEHVLQLLKK